MKTRRLGSSQRLVVCEAIRAAPGEVVVVPWGDTRSIAGDFVLDEHGAAEILARFRDQGNRLVIDYEHQTVGAEFSSPDGTAPAAGWITALRVAPGKGIYATVEWTKRAAAFIAAKEYLYLSPVLIAENETRRAIGLHSVALTNAPAIKGFPVLVNKDTVLNAQENTMDEIIAAIERLIAQAEAGEVTVEQVVEILAAILEKLQAAKGGEGAVADTDTVVAKENIRLRGKLATREFDELLAAHSGRIPPAQLDAFRSWWGYDHQAAETFIKNASPLVFTRANTSGGVRVHNAGAASRGALIHKARAGFEAEKVKGEGKVVCSAKAWTNMALRDAGLPRLTDDEVRQYSIAESAA